MCRSSSSTLQTSAGGIDGPHREIQMGAMSSSCIGDGDGDDKPRCENEYEEQNAENVYQDIDDVNDGYEAPSKIEAAAIEGYEGYDVTLSVPSMYMNKNEAEVN